MSVEPTIGTPVAAAARAATRSPCPSGSHSPITPTGASSSGVGSRRPNSCTDRSRSATPTSIRGINPHQSNAVTLASWVCSSPAPPATYDQSSGESVSSARRARSAYDIGSAGRTPSSPAR
jgi:hypothetical protein